MTELLQQVCGTSPVSCAKAVPCLWDVLKANGLLQRKLLCKWRFCNSVSLSGVLPQEICPLVGTVAKALGSWDIMYGSGRAALDSSVDRALHKAVV